MRKNMARLKRALGIVVWSISTILLSTHWIALAQQNEAEDDPRFTGPSASLDTEGLRVSRRHFEAGARSAWHRHPYGQLLFVEEGRARTQKRGATMREMNVGDSDYTGPNVEHWHGAAPDVPFIQVAVGFGEGIEWFDKVTDEEYNGR